MSTPAPNGARFRPPPELVPFRPDPAADLPHGAEVVIVGAGFVGAQAAYRLALAGMRPLVIEANTPASGASGRLCGLALAGVGGHFGRVSDLVRQGGGRSILDYTCRSLDLLEELHAILPGGIDWERCGSLDLLTDDAHLDHARAVAAAEQAEGLEVQLIGPEALAQIVPALDPWRVLGAKWTPGDGQLNPFKLVYGLLEAAIHHGAQVVRGVRAERLVVRGGRIAGIETSAGRIDAPAVLLATNAWTPVLAPSIGANITPIREHILVTERMPRLLAQGFETNQCNEYWRQEPTGELLVGGMAVADDGMGIGSYSTEVRSAVPPLLAQLIGRFHPALRDARVVRSWTGLLDFASLEIPMAGPLPAEDGTPVPGGYLICGLTGHGLPYSPILSLLVAEQIADGAARTLPLAPFDPRRYAGVAHEPTWLGPFQGAIA